MNDKGSFLCGQLVALSKFLLWTSLTTAGALAQSTTEHEAQLSQQIEAMKQQLAQTQTQLNIYHLQLNNLEQKVVSLQEQLATVQAGTQTDTAAKLADAVSKLQEEQAVQQTEIAVHEQTKVETASRFPLRVSGLVLFNANAIDGVVNNPVLPVIASSRTNGAANGSLSATMSQTLLGLGARGPEIWGAHTYGDVQVDFFTEQSTPASSITSPAPSYFSPAGILRLRTADVQVVWPETTLQAGIRPLILSPKTPTSYLSVAEPAMSWSGNLWAWIPQLTVGQDMPIDEQKKFTFEGSLLDVPDAPVNSSANSIASAAEHSRYPSVALHSGYSWGNARKNSIGLGAYWSPHAYGAYGHINGQAVTGDWQFALPAHLSFLGQLYHGAALGGLNGGAYKDYVYAPSSSQYSEPIYHPFRDQGGWTQLSWDATNRLEFNLAFGEDSGNTRQLRYSSYYGGYSYAGLVRNQTTLANIIYRPHSSIILSTEYRKLNSWQILGRKNQAQIFGLAAGYQF